jgi:dipeptidyl-peptidase-4
MRTSLCLLLLLSCLPAQDPGRLDAARITSGEFASERFGPARWLDGGHYATLEADKEHRGLELVRYDAVSGKRDVLVDIAHLRVSGREQPLQIEDYRLSDDGQRLLVFCDSQRVWRTNTRGEYFVLDIAGTAPPRRLGGALPKSTLMFAKFAPHGDRVAYVASNDLYVEDLASGKQTRLTNDGSKTVINGTFDWVYEEEFFCQDGFRWSPDGTRIAYWQLDCSGVGEFLMIDNLSDRYSKVEPVQYPKAGTQNSSCRIGVVSASGGDTVWMKTEGDPRETYLPRMEWHPDGKELMVQWQPRAQNVLKVLGCAAATGVARLVHEESDKAYVDVRDDFRWLASGKSFLWTTDDRDGPEGPAPLSPWRCVATLQWHEPGLVLDRTQRDRFGDNFPEPLTNGFDVMSVDFADVDHGKLFVSGCDGNPTQKYLFAAAKNGCERVSPKDQPGWHDYQISNDGSLAIHTYSHFDSPPVIDLVKLPTHERVRVLVDNNKLRAKYTAVQKGRNEFFRVATEDGIELDGWAMYPPDFDATKSWPVLFHVYGEPWAQTVMDRWNLAHHLFHRWLTQQGYVVMSLDARGTPAPRGRDWRKALYQKIGITSSHDWDQAVRALCAQHSWMDKTRLAIWGWSGGGAMTLNMLFRYPDLFAAGMSVAPVTDIALYDTIYQERYCGDPRLFPDVYRDCSPINFAKNLKGKLLLVHGTGDDNVHYQNSERLVNELVADGKLFEFLAYPNRTHSIGEGKGTRAHLYGSLADFLTRRVAAGAR